MGDARGLHEEAARKAWQKEFVLEPGDLAPRAFQPNVLHVVVKILAARHNDFDTDTRDFGAISKFTRGATPSWIIISGDD